MKTFRRSVAVYVALCREVHEDDGTSHLAATRLVTLTHAIPALLWLVMMSVAVLWSLWRVRVSLTRRCASTLTRPYRRFKVYYAVIQIGINALVFGLTPAPVRVR